jgi:putative DNA primase/helicase
MTDRSSLPEAPPPVWDNIPPQLAERQQWLLWKFEAKEGAAKPAKMPYYVGSGRRTGDQGSDRDRSRLATLAEARHAYERGGWSGVGFAFLPDDGLIGIDIDGAIDKDTGEVSERCMEIVRACDSFTEYSPSGRGVHIYVAGKTNTNKSNEIGLEVFCGRQFFTVTGRAWPNTRPAVRELEDATIRRLHATIDQAKEAARAAKRSPPAAHAPSSREEPEQLRARVQSALDFMSSDVDYGDWISIGWALRDTFGEDGYALWDAWSQKGSGYPGEAALRSHWRSFRASGKSPDDAIAVVFARARDAGWKPVRLANVAAPRGSRRAKGAKTGAPPAAGAGGGGGDGPPADDAPPPDDEAMPDFQLLKGKGGKNEDCRENVLYCLRNDPTLQSLVAHNQFTELQDKTRSPPWGGDPGDWTEEDDLMLGEYLARVHRLLIKSASTIRAGVQMAARENKYHPVIDQLKRTQWDGIARLDTWMVDCLGAIDRPYVRLASRFFIMGMVARLLRPGCKFDYMLILQGEQGKGKSSAFRALADPYFMDTPFRIGDKDAYLSLQGVWLVEFSELESMSKAESTAIKAFVTSPEDRFRPPYGSRMVKMPRRAVLAGTTNSDQFLKDSTGERRFWPVHITEVRLDLICEVRDQLFAEAMHLLEEKRGTDEARYYPTREEEATLFHPEQDRWRMVDVWTDILSDYVSRETTPNDADPNELPPAKRGFFSTQELFARALGIKADRMDNARLMQVRVSNAMRDLGFSAAREPKGGRKRGYLREGWEWGSTGSAHRALQPGGGSAPQAQEGGTAPPQNEEVADADLPI